MKKHKEPETPNLASLQADLTAARAALAAWRLDETCPHASRDRRKELEATVDALTRQSRVMAEREALDASQQAAGMIATLKERHHDARDRLALVCGETRLKLQDLFGDDHGDLIARVLDVRQAQTDLRLAEQARQDAEMAAMRWLGHRDRQAQTWRHDHGPVKGWRLATQSGRGGDDGVTPTQMLMATLRERGMAAAQDPHGEPCVYALLPDGDRPHVWTGALVLAAEPCDPRDLPVSLRRVYEERKSAVMPEALVA